MILVWNGWGILGLLVPALFGAAAFALAQAAGLAYPGSYAALGVALSGLVVYPLGVRLNTRGGAAAVEGFRARREAELHHLVENGAFVRADGTRPSSLAQAREEAQAQLAAEVRSVSARSANRHSLFFVPLQWVGVLAVVGGIVAAFAQRAG